MERLKPERIREVLAAARSVRVVVVGDLMLDRYISGWVDRVSPEAPVPVVRVESEASAVGGAGNVAANVTALGAECSIVGVVGEDAAGESMRQALTDLRVDVSGVVTAPDRPTTQKTRILARRQQIVRVDREVERDVDAPVADEVAGTVEDLLTGAHVLVFEDYNKGVLVSEVIRRALDRAAVRGLPSVVDPKRRNFFDYHGATVFKPNAKELSDALGDFIHPDDPAWMEATRARMKCANLLLTLGEKGMALQTEGGDHVRVPAVARAVYDVSGAGDTVTAVTAVALAAGASVAEAAMLANHAAAIEVAKAGVATVSPDEILAQASAYQGA